jgi:hypothetical protein
MVNSVITHTVWDKPQSMHFGREMAANQHFGIPKLIVRVMTESTMNDPKDKEVKESA